MRTSAFMLNITLCVALSAADIATDPAPPVVRQARGLMFNGGSGAKPIWNRQPGLWPIIYVEYAHPQPLPFHKEGTVLLGKITRRQEYLSEDNAMVYTEYTIPVDDVLYNRGTCLARGSSIAVLVNGGTFRLPDDRLVQTIARPEVTLEPGKRYVLFLRRYTPPPMRTFSINPGQSTPAMSGCRKREAKTTRSRV
jgi:hypothetical protein